MQRTLIPILLWLFVLLQKSRLKNRYLSQQLSPVLGVDVHQIAHSLILWNPRMYFSPPGLPLNPLSLFFSCSHPTAFETSERVHSLVAAIALAMTLCVSRSLSESLYPSKLYPLFSRYISSRLHSVSLGRCHPAGQFEYDYRRAKAMAARTI